MNRIFKSILIIIFSFLILIQPFTVFAEDEKNSTELEMLGDYIKAKKGKESLPKPNTKDIRKPIYKIYPDYNLVWNVTYWGYTETYRIYSDTVSSSDWYVPLWDKYNIRFDIITGEPKCIVRMKMRNDGTVISTVYDLNGNTIFGWSSSYAYGDCVGDYIVRQEMRAYFEWLPDFLSDNFYTSLYNYKTDTNYIYGVFRIEKLGIDKVYLESIKGPYGVMNKYGKILSYAPKEVIERYNPLGVGLIQEKCLGFILDDTWYDYKFKPIEFGEGTVASYKARNIYTYSFDYISNTYYYLEDGSLLYIGPNNKQYTYFDDEVYLDYNKLYAMKEGNSSKILTGLDYLFPISSNSRSEYFIGNKENDVYLFNRNGEVVEFKEDIGRLSKIGTGRNKYNNQFTTWEQYSIRYGAYKYTDSTGGIGVLGYDLSVLIEPHKYQDIYLYFNPDYQNNYGYNYIDYLVAEKNVFGTALYDLYDLKGKLIGENLKQIYDIAENRIACYKGMDIGLMDFNGNWIVKEKYYKHYAND